MVPKAGGHQPAEALVLLGFAGPLPPGQPVVDVGPQAGPQNEAGQQDDDQQDHERVGARAFPKPGCHAQGGQPPGADGLQPGPGTGSRPAVPSASQASRSRGRQLSPAVEGGGVSEARGRHSKGPTLFPPRPNPGPPWQEKTDRGREQPPWRRGPAPFIPSARLSGPTRAALSGPGWGEAPPPPALT